jgi:hypothetical protein
MSSVTKTAIMKIFVSLQSALFRECNAVFPSRNVTFTMTSLLHHRYIYLGWRRFRHTDIPLRSQKMCHENTSVLENVIGLARQTRYTHRPGDLARKMYVDRQK